MAHPFVRAVLAASVAAGVIVAGAGPAAANEAELVIKKCYAVIVGDPTLVAAEACIPV